MMMLILGGGVTPPESVEPERVRVVYLIFAYSARNHAEKTWEQPKRYEGLLEYDLEIHRGHKARIISFTKHVPHLNKGYVPVVEGEGASELYEINLYKFRTDIQTMYMIAGGHDELTFEFEQRPMSVMHGKVLFSKKARFYEIHTFGNDKYDNIKYYCTFLTSSKLL